MKEGKMNTFKKNQIIITALAIMIAIAGYLNFTNKADVKEDEYVFNNQNKGTIQVAENEEGILVADDQGVNTNVILEPEVEGIVVSDALTETATTSDETSADDQADIVTADQDLVIDDISKNGETTPDTVGEAVLVSSNSVSVGYFLEAKIKREQTRAESIEVFLTVVNSEAISEDQRVQAASLMFTLQERIEKEAAAESLLEAKGYQEVFVEIDDKSVDVVVDVASLTAVDMAQITELVSRKTGVDPLNVIITPLKTEK